MTLPTTDRLAAEGRGQHRRVAPSASDPVRRWLRDLHAVEQQALVHLSLAARLIDDPDLARVVSRHYAETRRHRDALRGEMGSAGSRHRDLAATANRLGFLILTAVGADAAGKMLVDSITYEQFEIAAYRMLESLARERGEPRLAEMAAWIAAEEQAMSRRLSGWLDWAVARAHQRLSCSELLRLHLRDVHALETQAVILLGFGARAGGQPDLRRYCAGERRVTTVQRDRLRARLAERGSSPSAMRSGAMMLAGAAWGGVWGLQRYTPAKLTCFLYAERHLQIAAYELLVREADVCGDGSTAELARTLLGQERDAAGRLETLLVPAAAWASRWPPDRIRRDALRRSRWAFARP
jgi:ferritin-like metal-binding protein YciE